MSSHFLSPRITKVRIRLAARMGLYSFFLPLLTGWLLTVLFGEWVWPLDTLGQFQFQMALGFLFSAVAFNVAGFKTGQHLATIAFISISVQFLPLYQKFPAPKCVAPCQQEPLRIVQYNIFYENRNIDGVLKWAREAKDIDILVLVEISREWQRPLHRLKKYYPYSFITTKANPYDIAIFSKVPLKKKETRGGMEERNISVRVNGFTPRYGIPFEVYAVHVASPVSTKSWNRRNRALKSHGWQLRDFEYPNQIIVGDFNTTRFSAWFKRITRVSGLKDAQEGFGLMSTWSFFDHVDLFNGLQIDQMLVAPTIHVEQRKTMPDMGSDHLPVFTKLWLYKR